MRIFEICGRTETGPVRQANEDHILLGRFIKNSGRMSMEIAADDDFLTVYGMLFAIADGVGGEAGGALASRLALNALDTQFYGTEKGAEPIGKSREVLRAAGDRANQTLLAVQATRTELARMGCTLAGVCLAGGPSRGQWLFFKAGDSRVYRFRDGFLSQVTRDDTITALAVDLGAMTAEKAKKSAKHHIITNCAGSATFELEIDAGRELRDGDVLLICSDGLHDLVPIERMEKLLAPGRDVRAMADSLVAEAVANGGRDNISVILIRCGGDAAPPPNLEESQSV